MVVLSQNILQLRSWVLFLGAWIKYSGYFPYNLFSSGITEDAVRRYLMRKPMTTKDLLQKFKSKNADIPKEKLVISIGQILKKINPDKKKVNDKLYLFLKKSWSQMTSWRQIQSDLWYLLVYMFMPNGNLDYLWDVQILCTWILTDLCPVISHEGAIIICWSIGFGLLAVVGCQFALYFQLSNR